MDKEQRETIAKQEIDLEKQRKQIAQLEHDMKEKTNKLQRQSKIYETAIRCGHSYIKRDSASITLKLSDAYEARRQ